MRFGYVRVSSIPQIEERQREQLLSHCPAIRLYTEHVTGKDLNRPTLLWLLDHLREGDEIYVTSMDRLSRSLKDLLAVVETVQRAGASIHFLKEELHFYSDDRSPGAELIVKVMASIAEFERELVLERQREGIELAKRRGAYKGRKPLAQSVVNEIRKRAALGVAKTRIARDLSISVASVHRYLKPTAIPSEEGDR